MLGFAAVASGAIGALPTVSAPAVIRPPARGSGGALGFGAVGSAPVAAIPTFPPPAVVEPPIVVWGGGGHYPEPKPFLIVGYGYGRLPELEGEAHGTVIAGKNGDPDQFDDLDELVLLLLAAA
jgi:hypothetical protein